MQAVQAASEAFVRLHPLKIYLHFGFFGSVIAITPPLAFAGRDLPWGGILSWEHKTIFFSGNKLTSTGSCFWLLCFPERPTQHTASGKLQAIQSSSPSREGSWGGGEGGSPALVGRTGEPLRSGAGAWVGVPRLLREHSPLGALHWR